MTLAADLTRAEWRARRRTYLVLFLLLGATSGTYFLVLSLIGGMEDRIGRELSDTLVGDLRLTEGKTGLGDGRVMTDYKDRLTGLRYHRPDATVTPRLEVEALFLHDADFTSGIERPNTTRTTGILVGIDAEEGERVAPLRPYVVKGMDLTAAAGRSWTTPRGETLVPVIAGEGFLSASNVKVAEEGFTWEAVYNLTAGRFENGQPVRVRAIVVGSFATGFNIIDRFVVYMPRGDVGYLLGYHPTEPPANVLLAKATDTAGLAAVAGRYNLTAETPLAFRQGYLGPVFTTVKAFAWSLVGVLTLMTAGWIAHTLAHHVASDRRKIATLRAMGIPFRSVAGTYVRLALALGFAAGVAGVAIGAAVGWAAGVAVQAVGGPGSGLLLVPRGSALDAGLMVLLAVVTATAAALLALRRVRGFPIRDALRAP